MRIIKIRSFLLGVSLVLCATSFLQAQNITTIAGGFGNGNQATACAQLLYPDEVAVDAAGNLYISDASNFCFRKVTPSGIQTIFAGTGVPGMSGDGGPATAATIFGGAIVFDRHGNAILSMTNRKIRKVTPGGIITTIAGTGVIGYSGDGGPATAADISPQGMCIDTIGNIFFADISGHAIRKIDTFGIITTIAGRGFTGFSGDGGPATNATLNYPHGLGIDQAGNLYLSDADNYVVRKINTAGIISTVAGTGFNGYSGDGGSALSADIGYAHRLYVDSIDRFYIQDYYNSVIRKVSGGTITTVAGNGTSGFSGDGGAATVASLKQPAGICMDASKNLYIADAYNSRIRRVDRAGTISTVAGPGNYGGDGGPATSATLHNPAGTVSDGLGNIYIADMANNCVRKIDASGVISTIAGTGNLGYGGDGGPATAAQMNKPIAIAVDATGNIYVSDYGNHCVRKISSGSITTIVGTGSAGYGGDGGPATVAHLDQPNGLRVDNAGNIYIADMGNNCIRKVDASGSISTVVGNTTAGYGGDGGPATAAHLNKPTGVALDASGNLYVSDSANHCIRKISSTGNIATIIGNGTTGYGGDGGPATAANLAQPTGVTVDNAGNILVADGGNNRIRMVSPAGIIATIAGNGSGGYGGDGGPATVASISAWRVAVDTAGNLYIADGNNNRIRKFRYRIPAGVHTITNTSTIELTALPNPAKTMVTLQIPGNWSDGEMTIYNCNGQLATLQEIKNDRSGNISIALSHLAPGWYVAHLMTNTGQYFAKVLVER